MRLLVDEHYLPWEQAWEIIRNTMAYTNHTLLPEALETWPLAFFAEYLPRHLEIIYEINRRFLDEVRLRYPQDEARVRRLSLIDERGQKFVRMANLASVGSHAINGVQKGGFQGDIYPINPKHGEILGLKAYPSVTAVGAAIDLAVIAVPIAGVPEIMQECGQAKIPGAIIISAGGKEVGDEGQKVEAEIEAAAKAGGIRYLGPNCLGIICPHTHLNASFAARMAKPGGLALLSQSGAICSAVLDWAETQNIGFSHFVSMGSMADIDFAEMIDYLGNDDRAQSIIIYMENLVHHRGFMSAARSVSRVKPIIVVKSGRSVAAARAAASHTGALAGQNEAYNAAFRRAGIIRVDTIDQLFNCAAALGKMPRPLGGNLAILTNAGGPGVMAVDAFSKWRNESP